MANYFDLDVWHFTQWSVSPEFRLLHMKAHAVRRVLLPVLQKNLRSVVTGAVLQKKLQSVVTGVRCICTLLSKS